MGEIRSGGQAGGADGGGALSKWAGLPMVCPCPIDYGLVMFKSIFEMGLNGFGQFCPWTKRAGQIWTLESIIREKLG